MPKIGTIRLRIEGNNPSIHEIHYKQGEGFYIKGISDEFKGLTGFRPDCHDTERGLTNAVTDACRLYRKLKTQSKLVILYKCAASTHLTMNMIRDGEYSGLLNGVSNKIRRVGGFGGCLGEIGIDYRLAQEVNDGTIKKYYRADPITKAVSQFEVSEALSFQVMDYTEERWTFFENVIDSMKGMVRSMSKFFDKEPDEAVMFIESKMKLLN